MTDDAVTAGAKSRAAADNAGSPRPVWGRLVNWGPYRGLISLLFASPRRQFALLALFPVIWVLTQHLGPMLQMLQVSLLDAYPVAPGQETSFTLDNYTRFFRESVFQTPFLRTLTYSATLTLVTLIITYPVAYYLARYVKRENQLALLLLLLVPFWTGEIVRTYASAFAADVWQMLLGGFLLVIILFAPGGLVGIFRALSPASRKGRT